MPSEPAPVDSDALLNQRVRTLAMTGPLHRLRHGAALRQEEIFSRQDLRVLALIAIDFCIMRMEADSSPEAGAREEDVIEHMRPYMMTADPTLERIGVKSLGDAVLAGLMNEGRDDGGQFVEPYLRYDGKTAVADHVVFGLLRRSTHDGAILIRATHQAINLSLDMLAQHSLEDQAVAARHISMRHLQGGRFEKARKSAVDAALASLAYCGRINDILNLARENAIRADWPRLSTEISDALSHLSEVVAIDRQAIGLIAAEGDRAHDRGDDAHWLSLRQMRLQIERCMIRHHALLSRLMIANSEFERSYRLQVYRPKSLERMLPLGEHALRPLMDLRPIDCGQIITAVDRRLLAPRAVKVRDPFDLAILWMNEIPVIDEAPVDIDDDDAEFVDAEPSRFTRADHDAVRSFLASDVIGSGIPMQLESLMGNAHARDLTDQQCELLMLWILVTHVKFESGELKLDAAWRSEPLDRTAPRAIDLGRLHWGHSLYIGSPGDAS